MAVRIYDMTFGQFAGIEVPTTANSTPTRDGTEAYAQMVVSASGLGLTGDAAGEGNVVSVTGATITDGSITLNANTESVVIDTQGFENVALTVSGFGTATIAVQWSNLSNSGFTAGTIATVGSSSTATSITGNGQYTAASGGRYLRIITTAYTSGTLVVTPTFYAGGGSGTSGGGGGGDVNLTEIAGNAVTTGNGVVAAGTLRVAVASDSSMPLPSGAATAALQSSVQDTFGAVEAERNVVYDAAGAPVDWTAAVPVTQSTSPWIVAGGGTAGAPGSAVLTIQGIAAGTSVIVGGAVADDAAASGNPVAAGGRYTATAPTFTDGDRAEFRMNAKGGVIVGGATADNAAAPAEADSFPVSVGGKYNATLPTYTDGDRVQAQFGSRGGLNVSLYDGAQPAAFTGNNADGVTVTGAGSRLSTISFGMVYNGSTMDRVRSIVGSFGTATGVLAVEQAGASFVHYNTNASNNVKGTAGILHTVTINTLGAAANTLTLYNDTSGGTSNAIAVIDTVTGGPGPDTLTYDLAFSNGLQAVLATGTAADVTIVYR